MLTLQKDADTEVKRYAFQKEEGTSRDRAAFDFLGPSQPVICEVGGRYYRCLGCVNRVYS